MHNVISFYTVTEDAAECNKGSPTCCCVVSQQTLNTVFEDNSVSVHLQHAELHFQSMWIHETRDSDVSQTVTQSRLEIS